MFILLSATSSFAATFTVSSTGSYTTIQSAVDVAADGDTISVSAGTYSECVDLGGLDLTVLGASATTTIVDGGGCSDGAFSLTGGETAEISDLTITNSSYPAVVLDGAVLSMDSVVIESSGSVTYGRDGGAITASDSALTLSNSTFDGNSGNYGGAIYLGSASSLTADAVTFSNNDAQFGGGVTLEDASTADFTDCIFEDNVVSVSGYGKGGAIYGYYYIEVTIDGSTFTDNDSASFGGAIDMETYGSLIVTDSTFVSNEILTSLANPSSGGAIYTYKLDELSISGSEFTDNVGYLYGGAVFANNMVDETEISESTFSGNSIQSKRGGAVEFSAGSDLVITDCTFTDNVAAEGGGALSVYQNTSLTISSSTFSGNSNTSTRDAYGGAVFVFDDDNGSDLTVINSTFTDNTAALSGGGLYVSGMDAVSITDSVFNNNDASAITNTGVYYGGAANFYDLSSLEVAGVYACGNSADSGGGFYMETVPDAILTNTVLVENVAAQDGGSGFFIDTASLVMENNSFVAGEGGSLYFEQAAVDFTNNAVVYTVDNYGVYAADTDTASDSTFSYSDWYDNGSTNTDGYFSFSTTGSGNITDAPGFADYSEDGDCSNDDLTPSSGSALIDAGAPSISDPDGSDSDIGAYGGPESSEEDADGDGYYTTSDCDDDDGSVYPGATELCDGVDNDCDGTTDIGVSDGSAYYPDDDGDGFGDPDDGNTFCDQPSGYVADDTDCNDSNSNINPDATEVCDGDDNDCDGMADGDDAADVTTWYLDYDSDDYGGITYTEVACDQPGGYVENAEDCDDGDSAINPDATEVCDGSDNDCDGTTDNDDASDALTWYIDFDGDGYGATTFTTIACDEPSGYTDNTDDCDDTDSTSYPGADELCDGADNNCDGTTDEDTAIDATLWYADSDADSYGDSSVSLSSCDQPSGYVPDDTDCNDAAAEALPGGEEVCDDLDNDCDGDVDEDATDLVTYYADLDSDGYGDSDTSVASCETPGGYVADGTDCDDGASFTHPDADEICDGVDNNCDGTIDEDGINPDTFYADADGDGFGDASVTVQDCSAPSGYVSDNTDCDDTEAGAFPGGSEVPYDGIDNDCDGADLTDADGDGFDAEVIGGTDCDDDDSTTSPDGNDESIDGIDQDCDGVDGNNLDGTETDPNKGTCSYVGAGDAGVWALLGMIGMLRRRQRIPNA